jgi:hypothetical protein
VADQVHAAQRFGFVQHPPGLIAVHCHRLLTDHVRPGLQRRQRHRRMVNHRRCNAHQIDRMPVEHRPPVVIGVGNAKLLGDSLGALHPGAGN